MLKAKGQGAGSLGLMRFRGGATATSSCVGYSGWLCFLGVKSSKEKALQHADQ